MKCLLCGINKAQIGKLCKICSYGVTKINDNGGDSTMTNFEISECIKFILEGKFEYDKETMNELVNALDIDELEK